MDTSPSASPAPPPPPPPPSSTPPSAPTDASSNGRPKKTVWVVLALAALLIVGAIVTTALLLSGSAGQKQPGAGKPATGVTEQPADGQDETEETDQANSEGTPASTVIPECAAANPKAQALADEAVARYGDTNITHGEVGTDRFATQFGPAAQSALKSAVSTRACAYPFHLEAGLYQYTSKLSDRPREALISALKSDADFVQTAQGPAQVFAWTQPLSEGHWDSATNVHLFLGDLWVATYGPAASDEFTPGIVDALVLANPHLTE